MKKYTGSGQHVAPPVCAGDEGGIIVYVHFMCSHANLHLIREKVRQRTKIRATVLMYHNVVDGAGNGQKGARHAISADQFQSQMRYLVEHRYRTLHFDELFALPHESAGAKSPECSNNNYIIITFDDGYLNNYLYAFPSLVKHKLKATFFVVADRIGSANYMNWTQLKEMIEHGMDVQSHTLTHQPLVKMDSRRLEQELSAAKILLEKELRRPITYLSYPHGVYNNRVLRVVQEAGYAGGCTSDIGYCNVQKNPYKINRIDVKKHYTLLQFSKIVQRDIAFYLKIKTIQALKNSVQNTIGIKNYNRLSAKLFHISEYEK